MKTMADVWEQLLPDDKKRILHSVTGVNSLTELSLKRIHPIAMEMDYYLRHTCQCSACRETLKRHRKITDILLSAAR